MRPVEEIAAIARAGGTVHLGNDPVARTAADLIRIAAAAAEGQGGLVFNGRFVATDDLVKIAAAGKGRVTILLTQQPPRALGN